MKNVVNKSGSINKTNNNKANFATVENVSVSKSNKLSLIHWTCNGTLNKRSGEAQGILILFTAMEIQHLKQSHKTYLIINWGQINLLKPNGYVMHKQV
jgi:hypothetical protein